MKKFVFLTVSCFLFLATVQAAPQVKVSFPDGGEADLSTKDSKFIWSTNVSKNSNYLTSVGLEDAFGRYYDLESHKFMVNNAFDWKHDSDFIYPGGSYKFRVYLYPFSCIPSELKIAIGPDGFSEVCKRSEYTTDASDNFFILNENKGVEPTIAIKNVFPDPILISNGNPWTKVDFQVVASDIVGTQQMRFVIFDRISNKKLALGSSAIIKNGVNEISINIPSQEVGTPFDFMEKNKVFYLIGGLYKVEDLDNKDCLFSNCVPNKTFIKSTHTSLVIHKQWLTRAFRTDTVTTPIPAQTRLSVERPITPPDDNSGQRLDYFLTDISSSENSLKARILKLKQKARLTREQR